MGQADGRGGEFGTVRMTGAVAEAAVPLPRIGGAVVIPYGTRAVSPAQLQAIAAGRLAALNAPGAPVALIRGAPLRLCDPVHPFTRPPRAQDLAHGADQLRVLEAHLTGLAGAWDRPLAAAVAAWFAFVRDRVAAAGAALDARAGPLAGLVERAHWAFLAPMPLPRAHLGLGPAARAPVAGDFAQADLAFWTADGPIACFTARGTPVGARARERAALAEAGVQVVPLSASGAPEGGFAALGPDFADFTGAARLPRSPFRGQGLAVPGGAS